MHIKLESQKVIDKLLITIVTKLKNLNINEKTFRDRGSGFGVNNQFIRKYWFFFKFSYLTINV
jgi:hypothetical protein